MVPPRLPANINVAPNSPSARAQLMAAPATRPGAASGRPSRMKTRSGDAPKLLPTSKRSSSMRRNALVAACTKKGAETKTSAITTAAVEKATDQSSG